MELCNLILLGPIIVLPYIITYTAVVPNNSARHVFANIATISPWGLIKAILGSNPYYNT